MSSRDKSDRKLVRRVLAGDESAFTELFRSTYPTLYRFALARLGYDHAATEEVVQASLALAFTRLRTYRGEAALSTWLCTFVRYEISAHCKRLGRQPRPVELAEEVPEIRAALESLREADDNDPDLSLRRKELGRRVRGTLDHLPRRYGLALEWKYLEGLTVREIADRLDIGTKAAESVLTRARQAFRDGFTTLCGAEGCGLALRTVTQRGSGR